MGYFDDIQFLAASIVPACTSVVDTTFEDMYSVEFIRSGRMSFGIDGLPPLIIDQPAIFWHRPSHSYQYGAIDAGGWHHHYVTMRGERGRRLIEDGFDALSPTGFLPVSNPELFSALFTTLVQMVNRELPRRQPEAVILVERILVAAIQETRGSFRPAEQAVAALAETIESRPAMAIDFHHQAAVLGLSYSHLRRLFKRETGCSPQTFLIQSRLRLAAGLLRDTNDRIQEVAFAAGFEDPTGFTRSFRKHYGLSPRQYRDRLVQT